MESMIKKLRSERGMTQEDLAERTGLNRVTIAMIEANGLAKAKAGTVVKLADALGVDAGFLFANSVTNEQQTER